MQEVRHASQMRVRRVDNPARFRIPKEPDACMRCEGSGKYGKPRGNHKLGCGCVACKPCPHCEGTGFEP